MKCYFVPPDDHEPSDLPDLDEDDGGSGITWLSPALLARHGARVLDPSTVPSAEGWPPPRPTVYNVTITCADLSAVTPAPASLIPGALNGAGEFGSAAWTHVGNYWTFQKTQAVNGSGPRGGGGHVYQYTVTLVSKNGDVVSIKQSDPFILV